MENQKNTTADKTSEGSGGGHSTSTQMALDKESGSNAAARATRPPADASGAITDKVTETAGNLFDKAKEGAGSAYEAVADKASSVINEQKSEFTTGLTGVADTVRRVSGAITNGDDKNAVNEYAAQYTDTAAKKLEDAAKYFEKTDLKGMARDLESYARRNPVIFLGAAFTVGVLAARFIKSSPSPN